MMDGNILVIPLFVVLFFYKVAYGGVVYEFISFCRHARRPEKAWRHIFELFILGGGSSVWLNIEDQWPDGSGKWGPALPVAGIVLLIAYLYSSYRRRAAGFWVEVPVQLCLGVGFLVMTLRTLWLSNSRRWMDVGLPVDLLFVITILTNYQKWIIRKNGIAYVQ